MNSHYPARCALESVPRPPRRRRRHQPARKHHSHRGGVNNLPSSTSKRLFVQVNDLRATPDGPTSGLLASIAGSAFVVPRVSTRGPSGVPLAAQLHLRWVTVRRGLPRWGGGGWFQPRSSRFLVRSLRQVLFRLNCAGSLHCDSRRLPIPKLFDPPQSHSFFTENNNKKRR